MSRSNSGMLQCSFQVTKVGVSVCGGNCLSFDGIKMATVSTDFYQWDVICKYIHHPCLCCSILVQLFPYFTSNISYQRISKALFKFFVVASTFHFCLFQVTWLLEENLCFQLFGAGLKGCNVKGVNVSFIKNTSLFSWIEKHAKCFQYFLSCNKSTHHSLLQFCYISVNYGFFVCFLNLSRSGVESWGLNVDMAWGHFWKKL